MSKNIIFATITAIFMLVIAPNNVAAQSAPVCTLSGGSIVYFDTSTPLATNGAFGWPSSRTASGLNIDAGTYDVWLQTWDDHGSHGGQNQNNEVIRLQYMANSYRIASSGLSNDIPENTNGSITQVSNNITFNTSVRNLRADHAFAGQTSNPESVYPVCARFVRISPPTIPTPDPLNVSCDVSDTRVDEGDQVTFSSNVSGGNGPYTYDWNGAFNSSATNVVTNFNQDGSYDASVTVTDDDGQTDTATCSTVIVDEDDNDDDDDLEIECVISDTSIEEGDRITIEVEVDGGNRPYTYEWDGDIDDIDDFDDDDRSQRVTIDEEGRYYIDITVTDDDGNRDSDNCPVIRVDEEDDDNDINVYTNSLDAPTGTLAGLSSVYLNQVPYTGPENILKGIAFIALILAWSIIVATYFLRRKNQGVISERINAFKETNLRRKKN